MGSLVACFPPQSSQHPCSTCTSELKSCQIYLWIFVLRGSSVCGVFRECCWDDFVQWDADHGCLRCEGWVQIWPRAMRQPFTLSHFMPWQPQMPRVSVMPDVVAATKKQVSGRSSIVGVGRCGVPPVV